MSVKFSNSEKAVKLNLFYILGVSIHDNITFLVVDTLEVVFISVSIS